MDKQKKNLLMLTVLFVLLTLVFGYGYIASQTKLREAQTSLQNQHTNSKVLIFAKMFIRDILQSEKEVDFETRLRLENAARDLQDAEILAQWQKFTGSKTEIEAQRNVKDLLELLIQKIK